MSMTGSTEQVSLTAPVTDAKELLRERRDREADCHRWTKGGQGRVNGSRAVFGSTERRRSRTYPAVGYTTSPVLKPASCSALSGLN
jgi:hypothetical protein